MEKEIKGYSSSSSLQSMSERLSSCFGQDPFIILISCLISLRAKDSLTLSVCLNLFSFARTPQDILDIRISDLEKMLYSLGCYSKKAQILHNVCRDLISRFNGQVPDNIVDLLSIHGVGRKTANLVLSEGFEIPAICVDVHVHRISNRLGLVKTKTPEETEFELMRIVPKKLWRDVNRLFVVFGQNICTPISPFCSICPLKNICPKVGIVKSR